MGRKVVLGVMLAVLSAGAGGGVAIAATRGEAHGTKIAPQSHVVRPTLHHCHTTPAALALMTL